MAKTIDLLSWLKERFYTESEVDNLLSGKSDTGHTHGDIYYTESEVDTLLNGKAEANHNHDDRYYTESEVDTFLNGKSSINHTHGGDDVLFGSEGSQTTLTSKLTTIESDISALQTADWDIRIVQTLPAEGEAGALYFVPNEDTGDNQYDEYIWDATSERFEKLGQRNIDLSDYVQKDDVGISLSNAGILSISVE